MMRKSTLPVERQILRLRRRLLATHFFLLWLKWAAPLVFAFGMCLFLFRFFEVNTSLWPWVLSPLLAVIAALALYQSRKDAPSSHCLQSYLDRVNGCGGLLMSQEERSLASWPLPRVRVPTVSAKIHSALVQFGGAVLFFGLGLMSPDSWFLGGKPRSLDLEKEVEKLVQQVQVLKEEDLLTETEQKEYQSQIEQLRREASADDPGAAWSAMDHLLDALSREAEQAMGEMERSARLGREVAGLSEALAQQFEEVDATQWQEAGKELADLIKESAQSSTMFDLPDTSQLKALENSADPALLKELAKEMNLSVEELLALAGKLKKVGLISPGALEKMMKNNGKPLETLDLSDFLVAEMSAGTRCQALSKCVFPGGISRGGGDADLTWKDGSEVDTEAWSPVVLPLSENPSLDQTQVLGQSAATPEVIGDSNASFNRVNSTGQVTGGGITQSLLPKHRSAVKRYFQKDP